MKFLVDANLPRKFSWFHYPEFYFVADWGDDVSDSEVWNAALENNWVIISRDSDFFHRMMQASDYPKVIYLQLQQAGLKELHKYFTQYWSTILHLIKENRMIIANDNSLEVY